jgi:uncharacterized protein (DUF2345 family)
MSARGEHGNRNQCSGLLVRRRTVPAGSMRHGQEPELDLSARRFLIAITRDDAVLGAGEHVVAQ